MESDVGPRRADGERHHRGDVHRPLPLVPQGTRLFFLTLLFIQLAVRCIYDRARRGTTTLSYIRAITSLQMDFTSAWCAANRVRQYLLACLGAAVGASLPIHSRVGAGNFILLFFNKYVSCEFDQWSG